MITFDDLRFKKQVHGGIGAVLKTKSKVTISIQAGECLYSVPRENDLELYSYTNFEVALLNTKGEFITPQFMNCHGDMVAGFVPREVINNLIYQLDQ
tara:strand:- start:42 stop:332 length:291 start_codon:yes stop_codon:yes gene_type:complete